MLHIYASSKDICIGSLWALYFQESEDSDWGNLIAQQDFYSYVLDFLKQENSVFTIWELEGRYVSALRMEPYRDGLLVEGLVTDVMLRKHGYARALLNGAVSYAVSAGFPRVYSHIRRNNRTSIAVHLACGFRLLDGCAAYVDGTVDCKSNTYVYIAP